MRAKNLILPAILLSACTIQQQNGNQWNLEPPPLLVGNQWHVSRQENVPRERVCVVSSGEMYIAQHAKGNSIVMQIGVYTPLGAGDFYRVIVGGDVHETA